MNQNLRKRTKKVQKAEVVDVANEAVLVAGNVSSSDIVTMNNLLGITQSHIQGWYGM